MKDKIDNIQRKFAYFGFTCSPLTRRKIASLLIRGFDDQAIYTIGCGVFANE